MKLISQASLQIQKPINVVYEGIVDPDLMRKYFISESSGRLETGSELKWKFPEFDDEFPIKDIIVEPNHLISFVWDPETTVRMTLETYLDIGTIVRVSEDGKELNAKNLKWLISNTAGWANFLASMKAYLEYGIQLRKGAYEFMKNKDLQ